MLGSGSSPNEALNAGINRHLKQGAEIYSTALDIQLHIFREGKLLRHALGMHTPALWSHKPHVLVAAGVDNQLFDLVSWTAWTSNYYTIKGTIASATNVPLMTKRKGITQQIREHKLNPLIPVMAKVMKKPAGCKQKACCGLQETCSGFTTGY